jgi:phospholipid/cholesterol/gamma-HCH transport system substrate-binding protein
MNTAENRRSVIVAIFVALGILILVSGIFILGGQQKRFERTIKLVTVFNDVSGLRKGNNVWFSGVKIGTVKEIKFKGNSQVAITMRIEEDVRQYIRRDCKVKISSESLIGNKILLIYGGSTEAPAVEDGDIIISETPASTEDMMATLQETNKNLVGITKDLKELSFGLVNGKGTVGALLNDSSMALNVKKILDNLNAVSANTERASLALSSFTGKMNTKGGLANQLLTDTAVFSQLKAAVAELQQTTVNASEATGNISQASNKLNQKDNGVGVLLNDPNFASQLQNTMENLQSSTEKLDENMEALKHNFLLRGYYKKKAKKDSKNREDSAYK